MIQEKTAKGTHGKAITFAFAGAMAAGCATGTAGPRAEGTAQILSDRVASAPMRQEPMLESVVLLSQRGARLIEAAVVAMEPLRPQAFAPTPSPTQDDSQSSCSYELCRHLEAVRAETAQAFEDMAGFIGTVYRIYHGTPVRDAHLTYQYFDAAQGVWHNIPGCEDVRASSRREMPYSDGEAREFYFASCDASAIRSGTLRVTFRPSAGQAIYPSSALFDLR